MSRCRDCGREWRSLREAHCVVCCEHFVSNGAADQHWVGGRHVAVGEMPERRDGSPRLVKRSSKFGPVWGYPPPAEEFQRVRRAAG